jgi:hypothetical protein
MPVSRTSSHEALLTRELRRLGVPAALVARLRAFLRARHPGRQDRLYHSLAHTHEVAALTARMLHSWPRVPKGRKVLIVLAAALHDIDPRRRAGTPARVSATLKHIRGDREARALLKELGSRFDFTPAQVSALILATDYSPHPDEMRGKRRAFEAAQRAAFGRDPWIRQWGRRLAYWDQIASYLETRELARRRVAGLARELRALRGPGRVGDMNELSRRFLARLRRDALFHYLPAGDRRRFDAVLKAFAAA